MAYAESSNRLSTFLHDSVKSLYVPKGMTVTIYSEGEANGMSEVIDGGYVNEATQEMECVTLSDEMIAAGVESIVVVRE